MKKTTLLTILHFSCFVAFGIVMSIIEYNPWDSWQWWALIAIMLTAIITNDLRNDALVSGEEQ